MKQWVKCIGQTAETGALQIETKINEWITEMEQRHKSFIIFSIDIVMGKTFTMATILYGVRKEEEDGDNQG